jgi:hypothetical protein
MSNDLVPVSDEQAKAAAEIAKATGQSIEAVSKFLSFWASVFGDVPQDLVSWFFGDRLHHARIRNLHKLWTRTEEILKERKVEPEPISEDLATPLLKAAREQSREELQELFARLLAAAMDPARRRQVRREFIETVRQMEPIDALVLMKLSENAASYTQNPRDTFAALFKTTSDELEVSITHLGKLGLVASSGAGSQAALTVTGRTLTRALRD